MSLNVENGHRANPQKLATEAAFGEIRMRPLSDKTSVGRI